MCSDYVRRMCNVLCQLSLANIKKPDILTLQPMLVSRYQRHVRTNTPDRSHPTLALLALT